MSSFVEIPIDNDPESLKTFMYELVQSAFPDWDPTKAALEKFMIDGCALLGADLADMNIDVQKEIFRQFGLTMIKLPPLEAVPSTGIVTIEVRDAAGYTIFAGTEMTIEAAGDEKRAFRTRADVVIPPGATKAEGVVIEAVEPGAADNELKADAKLLDSIQYIEPDIVQTSVQTSNGVDAETPDEYLDRLSTELELLTETPILPEDYAKAARRIAGVYRALAIDGYDPKAKTEGHERMVAVALIDQLGEEVNEERQLLYKAAMEEVREVSFIVNLLSPAYTELDSEVHFKPLEGFDPEAVKASVKEALQAYLDPSNWGNSISQRREWRQVLIVRWTELIALVNSVSGVDYVTTLKLAKHGKPLEEKDVALTGPAALTRPATITAVPV